MTYRGWRLAALRRRDTASIEDDFELQWSELANTLGPTGLDILASLVPEACAATFAHSSRTWTTDLPDLIQEGDSCQKYPLVKGTFF